MYFMPFCSKPSITLDRDALYIVLCLLPFAGLGPPFVVWELLHVDPHGNIMCHRWWWMQNTDPELPAIEECDTQPVEPYDFNFNDSASTRSDETDSDLDSEGSSASTGAKSTVTIPLHPFALGFFKVSGFRTPSPENQQALLMDIIHWRRGRVYDPPLDLVNRPDWHSRSWAMSVIEGLAASDVIRSEEHIKNTGRVVDARGWELEGEWWREMGAGRGWAAEVYDMWEEFSVFIGMTARK